MGDVRVVVLLSAVLVMGCPSSSNKCVPGKVESCPCAIGIGNQVCKSDGTFDTCQCVSGAGGGSATGGGSAVGGGSSVGGGSAMGGGSGSGGGIGMMQQEVVSGSRLKALHLTGDDGSDLSSVNAFWDTQLQLLCVPTANYSYSITALQQAHCFPLFFLYESSSFSDPACQTPAGYETGGFTSISDVVLYQQEVTLYLDGGSGSLFQYATLADGGWAQVGATTTGTSDAYFRTTDGGCRFDSSGQTFLHPQSITPVPSSTFVGFTSRHD